MRALLSFLVLAASLAAANLAAQSIGEMPSSLEQVQKRFSEEKKQGCPVRNGFPAQLGGELGGARSIFSTEEGKCSPWRCA
jgi:hypothetical protein